MDGIAAIDLPGAVAYSFLPHTAHARRLANLAYQLDKEVLLHLPMQSENGRPLGAGGLTEGMTRAELRTSIEESLSSIPRVVGVSNHMGSLLTQRREPMRWLMETIGEQKRTLFFVDSRTTAQSVAASMAERQGLPMLRRDVFLDPSRRAPAVVHQFGRLVAMAKDQGTALGIGHPYPETLSVLNRELRRLQTYGVRLVPLAVLLRHRETQRAHSAATPHALADGTQGLLARH